MERISSVVARIMSVFYDHGIAHESSGHAQTMIMVPPPVTTTTTKTTNTRALTIFTTYILTNIFLTLLITRDIYATYRRRSITPPDRKTGSTRTTTSATARQMITFITLAALSLLVTWYFMVSFFTTSYRSWAHARGIPVPYRAKILTGFGFPRRGRTRAVVVPLELGSWLKDSQLFREAWETVVETGGRMLWSHPIFYFAAGWSYFVGREAQRLRIPHAWAYMLLGQLVAISFAMNLFYIAVVVYRMPVPSPTTGVTATDTSVKRKTTANDDSAQPGQPTEHLWLPTWYSNGVISFVVDRSVDAVDMSVGTRLFLPMLAISHVILFLPPLVQHIWAKSLRRPVSADVFEARTRTDHKQLMFWGALNLARVLWNIVHDHGVQDHVHRHSNVQPPFDYDGENVVAYTFRSLLDHPAVLSVGCDSLLCSLAVLTWLKSTARFGQRTQG